MKISIFSFITGIIFAGLIRMLIDISIDSTRIKPIDVYRGKTTLEITYKDSVAIDSTVVWKNK